MVGASEWNHLLSSFWWSLSRFLAVSSLACFLSPLLFVVSCLCQAAANEAARRVSFESALKRTYFHVKPVPEPQLSAWRKYIHFEQGLEKEAVAAGSGADASQARRRLAKLFERCMVVCANYSEFWLLYADWAVRLA